MNSMTSMPAILATNGLWEVPGERYEPIVPARTAAAAAAGLMPARSIRGISVEPTAAAQPAADAAQSDAVVSGIEQDILTQYETQEPQQESANEEHDAKLPPVDGSAAPNEFAFDLGELKFGRNYGGKE